MRRFRLRDKCSKKGSIVPSVQSSRSVLWNTSMGVSLSGIGQNWYLPLSN